MRSHLTYWSYVLRHKWFVFLAGRRVGAPLWRLLIHDWSKFRPCEWRPYARYFRAFDVQSVPSEEAQAAFDVAWLRHQHANRHHWQHWVLREDSGATKALEMPERYAREMVADWMGAGRAINGVWDVVAWYGFNRDRILLGKETREFVEYLIRKVSS